MSVCSSGRGYVRSASAEKTFGEALIQGIPVGKTPDAIPFEQIRLPGDGRENSSHHVRFSTGEQLGYWKSHCVPVTEIGMVTPSQVVVERIEPFVRSSSKDNV